MVKIKVEDIQNNETTDDYETRSESDNEMQEVVEAKTKNTSTNNYLLPKLQ